MSVKESEIVSMYSDPLPCKTCKFTLKPVGKFRRDESALCEKYDSMGNMKPYGVLFCGEKCDYYEKGEEQE